MIKRVGEDHKKFLPKFSKIEQSFFDNEFQLNLLIMFEFLKKYILMKKYVKIIRENKNLVIFQDTIT